MKALSFRQPWAELILQGRKTLDLRTYSRDYRGPLAIHATQEIEREACLQHSLNPNTLPTGGVVGIVELVDIVSLDEAGYAEHSAEHLAGRHYREPMYGWVLRNPQRLSEMIPWPGQRNLFTIDLPIDTAEGVFTPNGNVSRDMPASKSDAAENRTDLVSKLVDYIDGTSQALPFELRVVPSQPTAAATGYSLTLRQRVVQPAEDHLYARGPSQLTTIATLGGDTLTAIAGQVIEALREAGYKPTDVGPSRTAPFYLSEASGVRLGLVMLAVKPLSKLARIEAISHGIRLMPPEEAYYWYSRCTARDTDERAQKALRILLSS